MFKVLLHSFRVVLLLAILSVIFLNEPTNKKVEWSLTAPETIIGNMALIVQEGVLERKLVHAGE